MLFYNSQANARELLENLDEMFLLILLISYDIVYYLCVNMLYVIADSSDQSLAHVSLRKNNEQKK